MYPERRVSSFLKMDGWRWVLGRLGVFVSEESELKRCSATIMRSSGMGHHDMDRGSSLSSVRMAA